MLRNSREQLVQPVDLVVGNAAENIGEPGLRINAIEFGGFDEGVGNGLIFIHVQLMAPISHLILFALTKETPINRS